MMSVIEHLVTVEMHTWVRGRANISETSRHIQFIYYYMSSSVRQCRCVPKQMVSQYWSMYVRKRPDHHQRKYRTSSGQSPTHMPNIYLYMGFYKLACGRSLKRIQMSSLCCQSDVSSTASLYWLLNNHNILFCKK